MSKDLISGIVLLIFCAFFYYQSTLIDVKDLTEISAAFFPRLILGLIALLAVIMIAQSFFSKETRRGRKQENETKKGIVWIIFTLFGLYVLSLEILGFIPASFLFIAIVYFILLPEKKPIKTHIFSLSSLLVITIALAFVFEKLLYVFLPRGIFF